MPPHVHHLPLILLLLSTSLLPAPAATSPSPPCAGRADAAIVAAAFRHVRNFPPRPRPQACQPVRELRLPSRNLTGAVSWAALANLSALADLDLSGNALQGAIPGTFWRAPSLRSVDVSRNQLGGALRVAGPSPRLQSLNVSGNRFTGVAGLEALAGLAALDVSGNRIRAVPQGLRRLARLTLLDLSRNAMQGRFPDDLPPLGGVRFLNVSCNNFSGVVDAGAVKKFGPSAFVRAGNASLLVFTANSTVVPPKRPSQAPPGKSNKSHHSESTETKATSKTRKHISVVAVAVGCGVASLVVLLCLVGCVACGCCRKNEAKDDEEKKKKAQWDEEGDEEQEAAVVAAAKRGSAAPVVLFERPLMELTLADLAAATSGFGRESQLAERGGRSGAAYRAVLPGDLHVVVRVLEGAIAGLDEDDSPTAAANAFRELARLRHPNILPLLGYCIAGNEKLLLYEYMEKGDLHRWLHELPAGQPDMDDGGGGDIWERETTEDKRSVSDWPTRHRIALGVARGLAFLHQGWAGSGRAVVHGHLVPTNVLLGDDLEPRIADFGHPSGESSTPEADVYSFGVLVLELMTGQARWDEASVSWARGIIRDGKGLDIVDPRIRDDAAGEAETTGAEREMVECLRVGYLCTAHSPDKRPAMQQVVGVLKDIRAATTA